MNLMNDLRKTVEKNKKRIEKLKDIIRNLKSTTKANEIVDNSNKTTRNADDHESEIQKTLQNNQREINNLKEQIELFKSELISKNKIEQIVQDLKAKVERISNQSLSSVNLQFQSKDRQPSQNVDDDDYY